jgi:hypothetical protein
VAALPLLAFTLARLWEQRDRASSVITAQSLASIGGVRGALAAHADGVLERLLPDQRRAAHRILTRLVAPGNTRARRATSDLGRDDDAFAVSLDALVRGRLVVARGSGEDATYELAHEGLIDGWPALTALISETEQLRALQARLAAAVVDWHRLDRSADGLWSARQLVDVERIPSDDLTDDEAAFVRASRRAHRRRRWLRGAAIALVPLTALTVYVAVAWNAARELDARVARELHASERLITVARELATDHARMRDGAFARFDAGELARAGTEWAAARQRGDEVAAAYSLAARTLEGALLLDTSRSSVRRRLAELTFERFELADRDHRAAERDELASRLELYDPHGTLMRRRTQPGEIAVAVAPAAAGVTLVEGRGDGPGLRDRALAREGTSGRT